LKKENSLQSIIYKNYLGASLIPIFVIELALLLLYFSINLFISNKNMETLLDEVSQNIREISHRETTNIDNQLREVSKYAHILQNEHQLFFQNRNAFGLPNGEVEFAVAENGAFYKKTEVGSSLYYASTTEIGKEQLEKALKSEAMDITFKSIVDHNPNIVAVYFNSWDDMNRLYPFMNDAPAQYGPAINMEDYNFYYDADAKHNPSRGHVWTGAYLDPAGNGWMVSSIIPIYNGDFLEGVTGIDVTIDSFVKNILNLNLPWEADAFLVDKEGMILAMPKKIEELFGLKELKEHSYDGAILETVTKPEDFNIFKNRNREISDQLKRVVDSGVDLFEIKISGKKYLLSQQVIPETGWRMMIVVDEDIIFKPIYELKDLSNQVGYIAIALMLVFYIIFFFFLLKRSSSLSQKIASPIESLSRVTKGFGKHLQSKQLQSVGILEIDQLSGNFNEMTSELDNRTKDLIDSQLREKIKEKEAEYAYSMGLFESASSYLHNIGNSLAGINGKMLNLRKSLDSTNNYGKVFDTIEKSHKTSLSGGEDKTPSHLAKFRTILVDKLIPKLYSNLDEITKIQEHMVLTIKHQQEQFNQTNQNSQKYVMDFDVGETILSILDDFSPSLEKHNIEVIKNIGEDLRVSNQRHQFTHGLTNIVKNAIEAMENCGKNSKTIEVDVKRVEDKVELSVRDSGVGISSENMPKIFSSGFTTKKSGHGIGLHSFVNFLNANNGKMDFHSSGEKMGTTFLVSIGDNKQE
jgi:signal transduction histidine kinase